MSATKLLELIEAQDLLPASMIAKLRRQVEANRNISAEQITKLLVNKGQLTEFQSAKLIIQIENPIESADLSLLADNESEEEIVVDDDNLLVIDDEEEIGLAEDDDSLVVDEDAVVVDDDAVIVDAAEEDLMAGDAILGESPAEDSVVLDDDAVVIDDSDDALMVEDDAVVVEESSETLETETPGPPPVPELAGPDLDGPDLLDDSIAEEATEGASLPPRPRGLAGLFGGGRKKARKNKWDSPLLLIGGGALILLVCALFGLIYILNFESGDDLFKQAESDFRASSYSQAISGYDDFLSRFPNHASASTARVRKRLAQIRQLTDHSKDWPGALDASEQLLPEIKTEGAAFSEAQPDLASLLPAILDGIANQASESKDVTQKRDLVGGADRALALVTNPEYIPSSLRKQQQAGIDASLEKLEMVRWTINRDSQLESAVATMETSIGSGELQSAYAARDELLGKYPQLRSDERLLAATSTLAAAERQQVKSINELVEATQEDHKSVSRFKVILSNQTGGQVNLLSGHVGFVLVRGAVYGVNLETGEILWRRYVGAGNPVHPQRIGVKGSDALVVDADRRELLRLESKTGKLVWRLALKGDLTSPVILPQQKAIVGCDLGDRGQLLTVDLETGAALTGVMIPRSITASVGVDRQTGLTLQAADEATVYVLQLPELKSIAAVPLDHGAGSVAVPPLPIGNVVLVAENAADHSLIRAIKRVEGKDGPTWRPTSVRVRIEGQVHTPMIADGRRAIIIGDRGNIHVFEVNPESNEIIRELAKLEASRADGQIAFADYQDNHLWVADRQLTHYELQLSRGRLVRRSFQDQRDRFFALTRVENHLLDVRQREDDQAITVAVVDTSSDPDTNRSWQTNLAATPAGEVKVANSRVFATTADGSLFAFGAKGLRSGRVNQAANRLGGINDLRVAIEVEDASVFGNISGNSLVLVDSNSQSLRSVPFPFAKPQAGMAAFANGVLVPTSEGTIELVDPSTGNLLTKPFQPTISADALVQWVTPTVVDGESQFVAADETGRRFRIGIAQQPKPHLRAIAEAESALRFVGRLASIGNTVYAISREASGDTVIALDNGELKEQARWALGGACEWGPYRAGEAVFVASSNGELLSLGPNAKTNWKVDGPVGGIVGRPQIVGNDLLLSCRDGAVVRLSVANGKEVAKLDIHEPIGTGPVLFGKQALVSSHDGTLHVVNLPSNE